MRSIICLRADDGGGYHVLYRVGETLANEKQFVEKIDFEGYGDGSWLVAIVTFDTGMTRQIPEQRIISWDQAPEVKA